MLNGSFVAVSAVAAHLGVLFGLWFALVKG